ncbi:lipoprotein NlpI [Photobacterium angustum]|uniref:Lipoprotein NlpI n=1 Tax=Photobacterium angustum TaxID=661 RepID=A0A855SCI3_PHOAN|nr:lipoprotein NlpI [Photobacterium angustum]KJF81490.1 lipoprotein NlpI [Photobacterium damselae subsp. damselae]KJG01637.1 lipoprotein NlpI [Photobacterium angustum]KJG06294.1 lipoprotein NlpI [Photobacterium angustum]KJG30342.1 lipoprotein NlpI [Photobacterium angustum]KJG41038.1 lipoprotein NlpI [Photobacterium angustum]
MIATRFTFAVMTVAMMLTGCSAMPTKWTHPPMAIPFQPTLQQQIQLARIDQILQRDDIPQATLAKIYYERGLVNDSLGLRDLARLDFNKSLTLEPNQPDLYNVLGVYFTQMAHFDAAYEAFDSTLELAPNHLYAQRNRGIALYYGERYELANQDLLPHYEQDHNDPYRVIWLYLNDVELTPDKAQAQLKQRYDASDKKAWGWQLVRLFLGQITERQLLSDIAEQSENNDQLAEHLTEAYFYLGKLHQNNQDYSTAVMLYKLALAGNVYEFIEHRLSLLELSRLYSAYQDQSPDTQNEETVPVVPGG